MEGVALGKEKDLLQQSGLTLKGMGQDRQGGKTKITTRGSLTIVTMREFRFGFLFPRFMMPRMRIRWIGLLQCRRLEMMPLMMSMRLGCNSHRGMLGSGGFKDLCPLIEGHAMLGRPPQAQPEGEYAHDRGKATKDAMGL